MPPCGIACTAFTARLSSACRSIVGSASTASDGSATWRSRPRRRRPRPRAGSSAPRRRPAPPSDTRSMRMSSGRANFRKPCTTASSRWISWPMMSACARTSAAGVAVLELLAQQLEVNGHRIERVLHLVRHAGRQPAERRHALGELRDLAPRLRRRPAGAAAARSPRRRRRADPAPRLPRRSSVTPSSPRPSRVRLLWMTWMGRSTACARKIATSTDTSSAPIAVASAGVTASVERSAHEQRRDADADVAERLIVEQQRRPPLQRAAARRPDLAQLLDRPFRASSSSRLPAGGEHAGPPAPGRCARSPPGRRRRSPRSVTSSE